MRSSTTLYHPPDVEEAYVTFGASCGPGALAAILARPVMSLRDVLGNFEQRGYCTPNHLREALEALGLGRQTRTLNSLQLNPLRAQAAEPLEFPAIYGLAFVQWAGPWLNPGVPVRVQYRYTHWVGVATTQDYGQMIYDVNAWCNNNQRGAWVPVGWWEREVRPEITSAIKKANGGYYVRTALEVDDA